MITFTKNGAVVVLFLIVVLAVSAAALDAERTKTQKAASLFFSTALEEQHISATVVVSGISYSVKDGDVESAGGSVAGKERFDALRTAYALALAQRSPLLAVPGTDPEKLDRAVTALADVASSLAEIQKNRSNKDAVRSSLYPIDFLRSLAKLERLRETFISTGADVDEALYRQAAKEAVYAFKKDLLLHKAAFTRIVPEEAVAYQVFEGTMTRESLVRSMDALLRGIRETAATLDKQSACISGSVSACDSSRLALPGPATTPATPDAAVKNTYPFLDEIRSSYSRSMENPAYLKKPVFELMDSVCMNNFDAPFLFFLRTKKKSADGIVTPEFMGDILFVPAAPYKDMPFYRYFGENKIAYVYFPLWEHYKCPEIALDTARIFGTKAVLDAAQTERFSEYAEGPDAATLRELETRLINPSAGIVRERDARAYVDGALRVLSAKQNVPPRIIEALLDLSLAHQYGTTSFDQFINKIAGDELANIGLLRTNVPVELEAKYLFYVRSGFFSLFQGTNRSITGVQPPPVERAGSTSGSPFVRYTVLRKTIPQAELVRDMTFFFVMHRKAIEEAAPLQ